MTVLDPPVCEQPDVQEAVQASVQPCTLSCKCACNHACTQAPMQADMHPKPVKPACQRGYSPLQINIIAILKGNTSVISHDGIAAAIREAYHIKTTSGAVRGALSRLYKQGFLLRRQARQGHIKGNRYTFLSDPCPHIPVMHLPMQVDMQLAVHLPMHPVPLDRKRDYKNLSVYTNCTEETKNPKNGHPLHTFTGADIAFHFPALAQQGFGTTQIQQIITRLSQTGTGTERLMQGLIHAEWELENGRMKDKTGNPVANPLNWVFTSLAREGYYRRPKEYRSPEEQAEQDAITEKNKLAETIKARETAEYEAWKASLSPEERQAILSQREGRIPPDDIFLRDWFKRHARPALEKEEKHE